MALDSHLTPSTWCGLITCRRAHARQAVVSKLDAMEIHSDVSACAGSRLRQRQGRRWRDCGLRRREAGQHAGTPSRGAGRCRHVGTPPQGGAPARRPARQRRPGRPTAPLEDHLQVEARRSQWGGEGEAPCPRGLLSAPPMASTSAPGGPAGASAAPGAATGALAATAASPSSTMRKDEVQYAQESACDDAHGKTRCLLVRPGVKKRGLEADSPHGGNQ